MPQYVKMKFCELHKTPKDFNEAKFKAKDPSQITLYNASKKPYRNALLSYEQVTNDILHPNYGRIVPDGCCFLDFDDPDEAEKMLDIILTSKLKCLILTTSKGYHFLFRKPSFYTGEMTKATNWFGYKFDTKASTDTKTAIQIMRVCGMDRVEKASWEWETGEELILDELNIECLDVIPYWLWGKLKTEDLHKRGKPGKSKYTLDNTPFTQLMTMSEGSRHNHIVEYCSFFALSNGFLIDEFKTLIQIIHDEYLVKIGTPMSDSDLFGDLSKRWKEYEADLLSSSGWVFDEEMRIWKKVDTKKDDKIDERRAAELLYKMYDFYVKGQKLNGLYTELFYREKDGSYEYKTDLTQTRSALKGCSDQNFRTNYFEEVEEQLMQICAENDKLIKRSHQYIIVKNKVLSCVMDDAYDFAWLGSRAPTDVVLPWNWYSKEWVEEHKEDLGGLISWFIKQLARNSSGKTDPIVEQWLYVIAGAAMIPCNSLEKIVVLSGGGRNGKSLYTSLIRLCLGADMFNTSKIFDSSPQDSFWGAGLDKGICCIIDDMPQHYNRDAFSYIKGAITKTDTVVINEKFKPKRELRDLPQIISCTNNEFELYDKSEGMKRRVCILPTEYEVPIELRDLDLQHKLVLNTTNPVEVAEYKMQDNAVGKDEGVLIMNMMSKERGVLESLDHGSLAWFANKCRYEYFKWLTNETVLETSDGMSEKMEGTFAGGFDTEIVNFLEWYITEHDKGVWTRELYGEYVDWHEETGTGEMQMKEKVFSMKLGRAIRTCTKKGYKVCMKKRLNDKRMSLNYLFIGNEVDDIMNGG